MEIKAQLNKPYTEEQRLEFIVEQNHANGFEIKETDTTLEAWGLTKEEKEQQAKEVYKAQLMAELDELDLKCIRALRAIQSGVGTDADRERLAELEEQAADLRQRLQELGE